MEDVVDASPSQTREVIWFQISGGIGTVLFYYLYAFVFSIVPPTWGSESTIAWTVSYAASIVWQHALHRYLVFKERPPYLASLLKTYAVYSVSMAVSSGLMYVLDVAGVNYNAAWGIALCVTGVMNYYANKWWVVADGSSGAVGKGSEGSEKSA